MMLMARSRLPVWHEARRRDERLRHEAERFDWRPGERVDVPPRRMAQPTLSARSAVVVAIDRFGTAIGARR